MACDEEVRVSVDPKAREAAVAVAAVVEDLDAERRQRVVDFVLEISGEMLSEVRDRLARLAPGSDGAQ